MVGKFIIVLAICLGVINFVLVLLGQNDFSVYFIVNSIAYFVISLFFVNLNPRPRMVISSIGAVIFFGFLVILVGKVIEVLGL